MWACFVVLLLLVLKDAEVGERSRVILCLKVK